MAHQSKMKKKDVNNDLSNFMSVFPNIDTITFNSLPKCILAENPGLSFGRKRPILNLTNIVWPELEITHLLSSGINPLSIFNSLV